MAKAETKTLRIAAMADIHYGKNSQGKLTNVFEEINRQADVLALCGDLTDYGLAEEAQVLLKDLTASVKIPILGVLGNHDFESGQQDQVRDLLANAGISMLDGETCEVQGVGFVGVKGFAGGFDRYMLTPWGEDAIKGFVHAAVDEALKLENALAKLMNETRVALLHYAPIRGTVTGENPEIFPFMGCSRLEEPLDHFKVDVAFHGHAHMGSPEGRTRGGVPVYNVSLSVLQRVFPDKPPVCYFEVPIRANTV